MKSERVFIIGIVALVSIASVVGFLLTFTTATQAALARVFIDVGLIMGLVAFVAKRPKQVPLRIEVVTEALRDLARGRYDKRILDKDLGELSEIAHAFNELAGTLSDSLDANASHIRYRFGSRFQPSRPALHGENHSYHPEIGTVKTLAAQAPIEPEPEIPVKEEKQEVLHVTQIPQEKELSDLYEQYSRAHLELNKSAVDFDLFKSTIDKVRADLTKTHDCKSIRFEVVQESGEVALRPRLIR